MFLWHFPSRRRARVLPGALSGGARTFLPRLMAGAATRPPGVLSIASSGSPWWARQGSNLRPIGYEPTALPLSYGPDTAFYAGPPPPAKAPFP